MAYLVFVGDIEPAVAKALAEKVLEHGRRVLQRNKILISQ